MSGEPVQRPLTEDRIARHWAGIDHRRRQRRQRRWARAATATALAAGVALGVGIASWWHDGPSRDAWRELRVEAGAREHTFELGDGSGVRLAPRSRVVACEGEREEICVRVERGRAMFDVPPRSDRPFRVRAGKVEVRVVGTRFSVERRVSGEGRRVQVRVEEGVVEVLAPGTSGLRLEAGRVWSTQVSVDGPEQARAGQDDDSAGEARDGTPDAAVARAKPRPRERGEPAAIELAGKGKGTDGDADDGVHTRGADAQALWERAMEARRRGDYDAEERSYAVLLRRFPRDVRAGQAAFELGRLRMDALGDPRGAIAPLRRAVAHGHGATFHQDALARLVRAYAALDRRESCRDARQRYLERYPQGSHARVVAALCGGE